jgi:transcriptional regulator with XRE-family HTH domain
VAHWTSVNSKAFIHRITFDFIAQLEKRIDCLGLKQSDLARKLNVTEGSVSQVLNSERDNLTLKTMVSYANALGMKVAVVAYADDDPKNEYGPVGSEIFSTAWTSIGKPRDIWTLNENVKSISSNHSALEGWRHYTGGVFVTCGLAHTGWNNSFTVSTVNELSTSLPMIDTGAMERSTITHA